MTDYPTVRAHYNDEGLTITPLNPASGVATRNHKGSQDPNSSLAASNVTGVTYYLQKLKEDREKYFEKIVPGCADQLQRDAVTHNWRLTRLQYEKLSRIAISRFIGNHFTHQQIADEMGVTVHAVKDYMPKINAALDYLHSMYRV